MNEMNSENIKAAYARWASVYDVLFGSITTIGRRAVVKYVNTLKGNVLEVGVGTGIALPLYAKHLEVTGIDLSLDMLKIAEKRVREGGLSNVNGILQMDAENLCFNDGAFENTVAMYLITVVPNPEAVMGELARVTKIGGDVILVNHFSAEKGIRAFVEKLMHPFAEKLGWRPEFAFERVLQEPRLKLIETKPAGWFGLFTMVRFKRI